MKINICLSSDNKYAQHLGVTIASILKNAKKNDKLFFYILDGGISEENKSNLFALKKIKDFYIEYVVVNEEDFKKCPLMDNHISIATYYRFMIPTFFPNLDKILYIDCDVIVEDSLSELYSENIDDYWMAGVEDLGYYYHRRKLKRETESFYVNAGVLLINLKKWREDGIEQKLFDFAEKNKEILVHQDQDVLNMVLNQKVKPLEYKWNVQDSFYRPGDRNGHPNKKQIKKAMRKPAIIHFTGMTKPWNDFIFLPMAELYLKYLDFTPWKGVLPESATLQKNFYKGLFKYWLSNPFFMLKKEFLNSNRFERRQMIFKHVGYSK